MQCGAKPINEPQLPNNARKVRVAIIGGGPAAVSLCLQISADYAHQKLSLPIEVSVFERNSEVGPGLPFSKPDDCFILNLPKEVMEPLNSNTGVFANWLGNVVAPKSNFGVTSFPPRHLFGKYLQQLATQLPRHARESSLTFELFPNCEVCDVIEDTGGQFKVVTSRGDIHHSDFIVFAIGHMPTATYCHFEGQKGYISDPWKHGIYADIDGHDNITLIGTRLTAIDTALKLVSLNYRGKINMVSRAGLLPAVLGKDVPPYGLKYLTLANLTELTQWGIKKLRLEDVMELFWKEISDAMGKPMHWDAIDKSYLDVDPLAWLNREIAHAERGVKVWQQILFALYPITPFLWQLMTSEDKRIFAEKYSSMYTTYLAAFPLDNAYKIRELLQSGQLEVHGGLTEIKSTENGYQLLLSDRSPICTKYLVNTTGPGYDALSLPLFARLSNAGLVQKHPLGGLQVDPQTLELTGTTEKAKGSLFAIGELTRGACLATTDMKRVAQQSCRISTGLFRNITATSRMDAAPRRYFSSRPCFASSLVRTICSLTLRHGR